MTTKTMLHNCLRAAEWLQWRAIGAPAVPPPHVLIEWSAAIAHLAATWTPPGREADIAASVASQATRHLLEMRCPECAALKEAMAKGKAS